MTTPQKTAYYVLLALVSALFLVSGVPKLLAQPMAVQSFAVAGLPVWLMYFIGAGEVIGAIGLWTRRFFRYAYEGLFVVLVGAVYATAVYVSVPMALFPLGVAIALGFVIWLHNKRP
ncbi:MAG: DoxX family protein [Patescibacteria group bacterium]|nr:DoxX family protein [Patescibacteria group bacterium]